MDNILFVDACVRPQSRTLRLAQSVLQGMEGKVRSVALYQTPLSALDLSGMEKRDQAAKAMNFDFSCFDLARQFAQADVIVIAAPYWDMMFPAVLKVYLENVTVCGLTFRYSPEGRPQGMCQAKSLHYVTTAGGWIGSHDFGFDYVKALAQNFFGIQKVERYAAEGLDVLGADVDGILQKAQNDILSKLHQ